MLAAPAVAPAVTVVKDEVTPAPKEEIEKEAVAARAIAPRAIPPKVELTQSAHEAHWDGLIAPMFRFPVY